MSFAGSLNAAMNAPDQGDGVVEDQVTETDLSTSEEIQDHVEATGEEPSEGQEPGDQPSDGRPRDERGRFVAANAIKVGDEVLTSDQVQALRDQVERSRAYESMMEQRRAEIDRQQREFEARQRQWEEQSRQTKQERESELNLMEYFRWRDQMEASGREGRLEDYFRHASAQQPRGGQYASPEDVRAILREEMQSIQKQAQDRYESQRRQHLEGQMQTWCVDDIRKHAVYSGLSNEEIGDVSERVGIALRKDMDARGIDPKALFSMPPQQIQALIRSKASEIANRDAAFQRKLMSRGVDQHKAATAGLGAAPKSEGTPMSQPEVMKSSLDPSRYGSMEEMFRANERDVARILAENDRRAKRGT